MKSKNWSTKIEFKEKARKIRRELMRRQRDVEIKESRAIFKRKRTLKPSR